MAKPDIVDPARVLLTALADRMQLYHENAVLCLRQLRADHLWYRARPRDNAVGNLILHVAGNLLQIVSRIEGMADPRDREAEFAANGGWSQHRLMDLLAEGVTQFTLLVENLPTERLTDPYPVRGKKTTAAYALIMGISHFSLHLGQMQFIAKGLLGSDYQEAPLRGPR